MKAIRLISDHSHYIIIIIIMGLFVENGRKLFVTLHIRNATTADDSTLGPLGRYECLAFAVGRNDSINYGFGITVLESKY